MPRIGDDAFNVCLGDGAGLISRMTMQASFEAQSESEDVNGRQQRMRS